jgi:alcohol dehydrogenase class IV
LRTVDDLLAAISTADAVTHALESYDQRDEAIAVLEDEIRIHRHIAEEDLRTVLRPHTRAALATRS